MPVDRRWVSSILCASAVLAAGCDGSPTETGPLACASDDPVLAIGGSVSGSLETSDPQLADDTFYDSYSLPVEESQNIVLRMTSAELDAFVYLLDAAERPIELNNDGGGGTDAEIRRRLERGCYVVYANSLTPETGAYTVSVAIDAAEG